MKQLFEEMIRIMAQGDEFVLVTVIAGSGSTPRGAGARMIVRKDGSTLGTIGGGAVEYQAGLMAVDVMRDKTSFTKGFRLVKGQAADLGMICGGDVVVYFQYVSPGNQAFLTVCMEGIEAFGRDEDSWIVTDITDETAWAVGICSESRGMQGLTAEGDYEELKQTKAVKVDVGDRKYYSEPLVRAGTVYVFGGGHVAQELVPVISHVGFKCVVYDDRPEFANRELFPQAVDTIVGDFKNISDKVNLREPDYVVIMTRGHQCDYDVQRQVLSTPAHYIGVMGSRHKIKMLSEKLMAEGFMKEDINRFYTPIGLPILAETPAEIAISVAGELIEVRAKREGRQSHSADRKR